MTTLRTQFVESLQSQGISVHTQEEYVRAVSRLARCYNRSPERIDDQEILNVLKDLKKSKGLSDGSILSALCGLRLKEGIHLHVADIDSTRMFVHVRLGKGGKDRYVPLPQRTLELLRQYWTTQRNPGWLFPATGRGGIHEHDSDKPTNYVNVQAAFRAALKDSGINKKASVHTLRHSYATHL